MESLEQPPFPPLVWEHYFWVTDVTLPSWAGFQITHGRRERDHTTQPADGTVRLAVSPVDSDARTPPAPEQSLAFCYLRDHESIVANAVAHALVRYCPGNAYDGDDEVLWGVAAPDDLRPLIRLIGVHVLDVVRDGVACVGFEFQCAWDGEHGAGVMTHRNRVIATGQADSSFTAWIARQGLDKP